MTLTLPAQRTMTVEEFEAYALLPENADRRLEWHDGEVITMVSSSRASIISGRLYALLEVFVSEREIGFTTPNDGGYIVNGRRYIPDGAFVSYARQPNPPDVAWNPIAPDLVIEVVSPTDRPALIRRKLLSYLDAGVTVWLVEPEDQTVEVYAPGRAPLLLTATDTLDGGDLLPGLTIPLARVFRPAAPAAPPEDAK